MECNPARPPPLAARRRGSRTFKSQIQFPECGKNSERRRCQRHFARKIAIALLSLSFVSRRILVSTPIRPLMLVLRSRVTFYAAVAAAPTPGSQSNTRVDLETNERTNGGWRGEGEERDVSGKAKHEPIERAGDSMRGRSERARRGWNWGRKEKNVLALT